MSQADLSVVLDSLGVVVVAECPPQSFSEAMTAAGFVVETGVIYSSFDVPEAELADAAADEATSVQVSPEATTHQESVVAQAQPELAAEAASADAPDGASLVTPLGRHAALYAVHPMFASLTKNLREFRQCLIRVVVEFTKRNVTQQQRPEQQQGLALSLFAAEWQRCFAGVTAVGVSVGSVKEEREKLGVMKLMPLLQAVPELAVTGVHPEVRVRLKVPTGSAALVTDGTASKAGSTRSGPATASVCSSKEIPSTAASAAALLAQRLGPAVGGLLTQALATADPQQRATVMRLLESIKNKAMIASAVAGAAATAAGTNDMPVTAAAVFAAAAAKLAVEKTKIAATAAGSVGTHVSMNSVRATPAAVVSPASVATSLTRSDVLVLLRKAVTHWCRSLHPAPQGGDVLGTVDGFRESWRRCYPSLRPAESYLGGDEGLKAALDELGEVAVLPGARIVLVATIGQTPCTPPLAIQAGTPPVAGRAHAAVRTTAGPVGPSEIRRRVQEIVAVAGSEGVSVGTLKGVYRTRYKCEAEDEAREAGFGSLDDVFRGLDVKNGRVFWRTQQDENLRVGVPRLYAKNQLLSVRRSALKQ